MKVRAFVVDDDPFIVSMLKRLLARRDYDVVTSPDDSLCPAAQDQACRCGDNEVCADMAIIDLNLDLMSGLDFVAQLRRRHCKVGCIALMSGKWIESDLAKAHALGCVTFQKPFPIAEINAWLDACEAGINPQRTLRLI